MSVTPTSAKVNIFSNTPIPSSAANSLAKSIEISSSQDPKELQGKVKPIESSQINILYAKTILLTIFVAGTILASLFGSPILAIALGVIATALLISFGCPHKKTIPNDKAANLTATSAAQNPQVEDLLKEVTSEIKMESAAKETKLKNRFEEQAPNIEMKNPVDPSFQLQVDKLLQEVASEIKSAATEETRNSPPKMSNDVLLHLQVIFPGFQNSKEYLITNTDKLLKVLKKTKEHTSKDRTFQQLCLISNPLEQSDKLYDYKLKLSNESINKSTNDINITTKSIDQLNNITLFYKNEKQPQHSEISKAQNSLLPETSSTYPTSSNPAKMPENIINYLKLIDPIFNEKSKEYILEEKNINNINNELNRLKGSFNQQIKIKEMVAGTSPSESRPDTTRESIAIKFIDVVQEQLKTVIKFYYN